MDQVPRSMIAALAQLLRHAPYPIVPARPARLVQQRDELLADRARWAVARRLPTFTGKPPELLLPEFSGTRCQPAGPMRQQWGA
ncbi:hypothetical protein [Streptomyces sp. 061-3]|uniref:hypothetical protein n=1 Tax=Streptomyces sp. 061-3 TaxID=2789268 RepID=UPI0039816B67